MLYGIDTPPVFYDLKNPIDKNGGLWVCFYLFFVTNVFYHEINVDTNRRLHRRHVLRYSYNYSTFIWAFDVSDRRFFDI